MTGATPPQNPMPRNDQPASAGPATPPADARPTRRFQPDFLTEMFRNPLDAGYAAASARRAERGPESARQRAFGRTVRFVALAAAGFLLAIAYHETAAGESGSDRLKHGLVSDVRSSQAEVNSLQHQADELQTQVSRLRDAALASSGTDPGGLTALQARVGLARVTGGGAVIRLVDAAAPIDPVTGTAETNNPGAILDRDLQGVVNELWRDGAEAIAINGQRLTATSTIRTAGVTILVDFQPVVSPYRVEAIGPSNLARRFDASATGRAIHALSSLGTKVKVSSAGNLTLPAAAESPLRYAKPVPSPSEGGP